MTDRELLELAAKAAEIDLYWSHSGVPEVYNEDYTHRFSWNPLTDDSEAMRLAVKLKIELPATRCDIVRAAAEIGRSVP